MQLLQQEVTPVTFQRDVLQLAAHKYSGEGVFILAAGAWKNRLIVFGTATILCCQTGCKVTLDHQISSGWGSFSWKRRECLQGHQLSLGGHHLVSLVKRKWCDASHPKVIPCYSDSHKQLPASEMPLFVASRRAGWFESQAAAISGAVIPSFRGWRKSSAVICSDAGKSLVAILNYFLGKLHSSWTPMCTCVLLFNHCLLVRSLILTAYAPDFPLGYMSPSTNQ